MRILEYLNVSMYRLKEFFLYTICGIDFYRNYSRFYWGNIFNKKEDKLSYKSDVSKQSELLFDFYKWQKENGCLYSDSTKEYKMKNDIENYFEETFNKDKK